jgi:hypothetical protein
MPPAPQQPIPTPVSADIYSEALEQQLALVRDLLSPRGPTLFRDPTLPAGYTLAEEARWLATLAARAQPFLWSAHLAHAIVTASQNARVHVQCGELPLSERLRLVRGTHRSARRRQATGACALVAVVDAGGDP